MYPMFRRMAASIGTLFQVILPALGVSTPITMRMVVDLPAPLAPTKPTISPLFNDSERQSSARRLPKYMEISDRTSIQHL